MALAVFCSFLCREDDVGIPTSSSRTVLAAFRPFLCCEDDVSTLTSSSRTVSPPFRPFLCREDNVGTLTSSSGLTRSQRSAPRKSVRKGQCLPRGTPPPAAYRLYLSATGFWALSQSCRCLLIVSFVRFPSATGLWVLFRSCRVSLMEQVPLRMAPVQAPWRGSVFWRETRATVSRTMAIYGAGLPTIFGPAPATDSSVFIVLTDG